MYDGPEWQRMANRRLLVDRVLCVAWRTPEPDDLSTITTELLAHKARLGRPLLYYSVIGIKGIPQGDVRDKLVAFYTALLATCDSMHVVIEGSEFEQSIKRSVIANVLLHVQARGRIFIENSLERVQLVSPPAIRPELVRAAQVATEARLWDFARADSAARA